MVTVQLPVPGQVMPVPLHPMNCELLFAAGTRVTMVPVLTCSVQSLPQLMAPTGADEVTVPLPVPFLTTVMMLAAKVAVTVLAASMVNMHEPVPEQPSPDQPVKVELADGAAVSCTAVPTR